MKNVKFGQSIGTLQRGREKKKKIKKRMHGGGDYTGEVKVHSDINNMKHTHTHQWKTFDLITNLINNYAEKYFETPSSMGLPTKKCYYANETTCCITWPSMALSSNSLYKIIHEIIRGWEHVFKMTLSLSFFINRIKIIFVNKLNPDFKRNIVSLLIDKICQEHSTNKKINK